MNSLSATSVVCLLLIACMFHVVGCDSQETSQNGNDNLTDEEKQLLESVDREWQLQSINGFPVPYVIHNAGDTLTILGGSAEFHASLRYDRTTFSRTVCSGSVASFCVDPFEPTTVTEGTYRVEASVFMLTRSDGLILRATLVNGVLSITNEGGGLTFQYN